jgi:hypothetical protein
MKDPIRIPSDLYPSELPRMANPFARSIRDSRLQFLEVPGTDKGESCLSSEHFANNLGAVEIS